MKITKTESGTYTTVVYNNGVRKHITAKSYAECKNKATEWLNLNIYSKVDKLLVKDAIQRYIDLNSNVLSPTTIRSYQGILKNYMQSLMPCYIGNLDANKIQNAINMDAKKVSPKTISNAYSLLFATMKSNDVHIPKVHLPQKIKNDIYIPTKEEIKKLIDNSSGTLHDAILLGAYLGLRRSEICALTPESIEKGTIFIKQARVKGLLGWENKTTKTYDSARFLPLPKALQNISLPISTTPNHLTQEFIQLRDKLGIPIRFHDLRHYFVSQLIANNVPNAYIRSCTGHSSDNMINKVYGHLLPEKKKEVINIIEQVFK